MRVDLGSNSISHRISIRSIVSAILVCTTTTLVRGADVERKGVVQNNNATSLNQRDQSLTSEDTPRGAGGDLSQIIVTGTRIKRDVSYDQPTPVTAVTAESLQLAAPTTIADGLVQLPQFSASSNRNTCCGQGSSGTFLNLRQIGLLRSLILLDGDRVTPTTENGLTDINLLPELLVKRVDVVTGGASAAYGSDAVSGVVNYIIDREFTGLKTIVQGGDSNYGDDRHLKIGVAGGMAFAADRGHALFSVEHYKSDGFHLYDRLRNEALRGHIQGGNGSAATPYAGYFNARGTSGTVGGLIVGGPLAGTVFDGGDATHQFVVGTPFPTVVPAQLGGDGFTYGNTSSAAELRTDKFYGRASFDITESVTASIRLNAAESRTVSDQLTNAQRGGNSFTIFRENAFLPAAVGARMDTAGVSSFSMGRQSTDFGLMRTDYENKTYDANLMLDGKLGSAWTWSGSYSHGETKMDGEASHNAILDNLYAAADAVVNPANGQIVCRVTLANPGAFPGCVPINLFGSGSPSQAALGFVTGTSTQEVKNTQDVFGLSMQGQLWQLPAGELSIAFGAEYRERTLLEESNETALGQATRTGVRGLPATVCPVSAALPCRFGRFNALNFGVADANDNVKEAFFETAVPLLRDLPMANLLELNGAFRYTDYSNSGEVNTWKAGLNYEPVEGVRLRSTRSRDIRAPNLFELFQGPVINFGGGAGTGLIDPALGNMTSPVSYVSVTQGNPDLRPEKADTWTAGLVYRPGWLPGFSGSVDYYHIDISDALGAGDSDQSTVNKCAAGDTVSCSLITRDPATGYISQVISRSVNVNERNTSGIDLDLSYGNKTGPGRLTMRMVFSHLLEFTDKVGGATFEYAGYSPGAPSDGGRLSSAMPKWRGNLSAMYEIGNASVYMQERYIGRWKQRNLANPSAVYAYPIVGSVLYTDITGAWKLGADRYEVYGTINNLFDRKPPLFPGLPIPGLAYPSDVFLYDIGGRYFTLGARVRF